MSIDLPQGWQTSTLGKVLARAEGGGTPPRDVKGYWNGDIPWASVKDIVKGNGSIPEETITAAGLANSTSRIVAAGTNIFAARMGVGAVTRYPMDVAINQDLMALTPAECLDPDYLYHWLRSKKAAFAAVATGTTVKGIRKGLLLSFPLPLPPIDEQRRIAEVLRSVDEAIAAAVCALDQATKVARAVMVEQLVLPRTAKDPLPDGWKAATFGGIGKVQAGRQRAPSFTNGPVRPYLRVANVFDGFIDTSDVLEMPFTEREYKEYRLLNGDILLNEGQSLELVGRAARYHGEPADCCFQNTLVRFRAHSVDADYAYTLIRTMYAAGRFTEIASRTTSVAHLGVSRFAALVAPVPPLKAQKFIAGLFDSMEQNIIEQRASLATLRAKKTALTAELLSGHVRVGA